MDILGTTNQIAKEKEQLEKFYSIYNLYPKRKVEQLIERMNTIIEAIEDNEDPKTLDELLHIEAKRKLIVQAKTFEFKLQPKRVSFEEVKHIYDIQDEDLEYVEQWLDDNNQNISDALERLFERRQNTNYKLPLSTDIPRVRRHAESFATIEIEKYNTAIGVMIQNENKIGEFLREITAEPTTEQRSYFNLLTKKLAISISAICSMKEDGQIKLEERELIRLLGHEGLGHAVNKITTNKSNLPYFLKAETSYFTSTSESIALFYENLIFKRLENSPKTLERLDLAHKYEEIMCDENDSRIINNAKIKSFQYALKTIANKDISDEKKINLIQEKTFGIDAPYFLDTQKQSSFDKDGNLHWTIARELCYTARPVDRVLNIFKDNGITYQDNADFIDETILAGTWTPTGLEQYAKIRVKELN